VTSAIILAGGLGTRLRAAVPNLPKPMAPINGRPFLEHQLDYWIGQGVGHFVLSVGYRYETITLHFGTTYRGAALEYAVEESALGTGGGLLQALQTLGARRDVLLLNGDTYFEVKLPALRAVHEATSADWTFALFRTSQGGRYMGLELDSSCRITSLKSGSGQPGSLANGGVYLLNSASLRSGAWGVGQKISLEDDILPALLACGGRFYGIECAGAFIDIGVPEDYLRAATLLGT
jgi:D-glycero-alpha-D-manno-heptose 1-phosphate guanylyltransferase